MGSLVVSSDRIGPWVVGVSYPKMAASSPLKFVYSTKADGQDEEKPTGQGCEIFEMEKNWPGMGFMFEDGILTRIDLFDPNSRTEEPEPIAAVTNNGIRIGDTIAKAKIAYGEALKIAPHPYAGDAGSYLIVIPNDDSNHGIIFETEGQIITSLRVGNKNSVQYIEGCL